MGYDKPLSCFAFNFNLRPYNKVSGIARLESALSGHPTSHTMLFSSVAALLVGWCKVETLKSVLKAPGFRA